MAKIGRYLSSNWSHMLFRTRYGTKLTIKSEGLARNHIEPYIPNMINANCVAFDQNENSVVSEASTQVENIPDILLDEWATKNALGNQRNTILEVGLGNYIFQEVGSVIPNLFKISNEFNGEQEKVWKLYFDGSRSKNGSGGGAMLVSAQGDKYYAAFRFSFAYTNNTAEYEGLIHGLEWRSWGMHGVSNWHP